MQVGSADVPSATATEPEVRVAGHLRHPTRGVPADHPLIINLTPFSSFFLSTDINRTSSARNDAASRFRFITAAVE